MIAPAVLNTRPRGQAKELTLLLRAAGFEPIEAPCVEVVGAWDPAEVARVLASLRASAYEWVVFPSSNAVGFFMEALAEAGGSAADLARARVLSGPGTARAVAQHRLRVDRVLARFSAAAALDILREQPLGSRGVLLPRAAEGREELVDGLRERSIRVDDPVVYCTQPTHPHGLRAAAEFLRDRKVAAVTLTSPSAARALVDGLKAMGADASGYFATVPVVCIGETTAGTVRSLGLEVARVAQETTLESLVEAVSDALSVRGVGASPCPNPRVASEVRS
jgi:uroporphyrinogen-III synthase